MVTGLATLHDKKGLCNEKTSEQRCTYGEEQAL